MAADNCLSHRYCAQKLAREKLGLHSYSVYVPPAGLPDHHFGSFHCCLLCNDVEQIGLLVYRHRCRPLYYSKGSCLKSRLSWKCVQQSRVFFGCRGELCEPLAVNDWLQNASAQLGIINTASPMGSLILLQH